MGIGEVEDREERQERRRKRAEKLRRKREREEKARLKAAAKSNGVANGTAATAVAVEEGSSVPDDTQFKFECGCSRKGRNLVVLLDGTANQFGDKVRTAGSLAVNLLTMLSFRILRLWNCVVGFRLAVSS